MKVIPFPSKTTPWRIVASIAGKRRSFYFRTKEEADKKLAQVKKFGLSVLIDQTQSKNAEQLKKDAAHWQYLAEAYGLTQVQITEALEDKIERLKLTPATVTEALDEYFAAREREVAADKLSKTTLVADRTRLVFLERAFRDHRVTDLDQRMIVEWIHGIPGDNGLSIFKSVSPFFKWLLHNNYLRHNPLAGVDRKKEFGQYGVNNEYYPVATFGRMLRIAAGLEPVRPGQPPTRDFIDMLPYFILGGFAGLRRCEIARVERNREALRWSDLYFNARNPNIEIRTIATKKTARQSDLHYVDADYALEAVQAWLPLCDCKSPFVFRWTTRQWQELKRRFKKATGIKFIKNGFRNSFATFALSYNGLNGLGQVAKQMGDLEGTVRRHYLRNLPAGSGRAWFSLRPFEVVSSPVAATA